MAARDHFVLGEDGYHHSDCLHYGGFTTILWDLLHVVGFPTPPRYAVREFDDRGIPRCSVRVTVPPHPSHPTWGTLNVEVLGHRVADSVGSAALRVLTTFCREHPEVILLHPVGLIPTGQPDDLEWLDRVANADATALMFGVKEAVEEQTRIMSALYWLYTLQERAWREAEERTALAHATIAQHQVAYTDLTLEMTEMDDEKARLQAQVAGLQAQAGVLQDQVVALQAQRDAHMEAIAEMEEELHDVRMDLDDANEHIGQLQQHLQQNAMEVDEEDPEEVQGMSGMDTESGIAPPSPAAPASPAESEDSVNNLDDF